MLHNTTIQYGLTIIQEIKANKWTPGEEFKYTRSQDIAVKYNLSLMFVEQILRKLKAAKIVTAHRGPGGGYELTDREVTALELYSVLTPNVKGVKIEGAITVVSKINDALASIIL